MFGSEDADYWNHWLLFESDRGCTVPHSEPTWYFSYLGRPENMKQFLKNKEAQLQPRRGGGRLGQDPQDFGLRPTPRLISLRFVHGGLIESRMSRPKREACVARSQLSNGLGQMLNRCHGSYDINKNHSSCGRRYGSRSDSEAAARLIDSERARVTIGRQMELHVHEKPFDQKLYEPSLAATHMKALRNAFLLNVFLLLVPHEVCPFIGQWRRSAA